MTDFKNNPLFTVAFHSKVHNIDFYQPASLTDYHISRKIAMSAQDIYSNSGATKDTIQAICQAIIATCNDTTNKDTLRTDVAAYANNLLYRTAYPVDEHCAIRMGALSVFIEGENPDTVHDVFTQKKMQYAMGSGNSLVLPDPELYAFFLSLGIGLTPSYQDLSTTLDSNYLMERATQLQSLLPQKPLAQTKE